MTSAASPPLSPAPRVLSRVRNVSGLTRLDNTFATARTLGVYRGGRARFRASGVIGRRDPVDFWQFGVFQGAASRGGVETFRVRGGSLQVSAFFDIGNGPQWVYSRRLGAGVTREVFPGWPSFPRNAVFYLRVDRPTRNRNVRYAYDGLFL